MNKCLIIIVLLSVLGLLMAQTYQPIPEVQNLVSSISADTIQAYVQHLEDYQTRYAFGNNQLEIATWLAEQFQRYGYTNTYLQEYQRGGTTQYNVIATLTGYQHPETYVIASAHYDSKSLNSDPFVWAPGADDNASGTAGLLEMARVMKLNNYQPRCTIRFIAFSNEEMGAWGSDEYCTYAQSENHDIRIMINMDMIGSNTPISNEFNVSPFSGYPLIYRDAVAFSEPYTSLQPVEGPIDEGGDGMIFDDAGYPSIMFIERYLSPYWHSGQDTIENIDFLYARQILGAATATTAYYANLSANIAGMSVLDTGTGSSLQAVWESSTDPEHASYAVFYGTDANNMALWQYTSDTQCLISGLEEGQYYYVSVADVNYSGYPGRRIYGGEIPQSLPRAPQLVIDKPNTQAIVISWMANSELDVEGYKLYRKLGQEAAYVLIATVQNPDTSYIDYDVSSSLDYYYYHVCAVDSQGLEGSPSDIIHSRLVSLDRGIYVIDESKNFSSSNPLLPSDLAVDSFYAGLLQDFTPVQHLDLEENSTALKLADIGIYSSILWHGNDNSDYSYPHGIQEALRQYVYYGGQILFSVYFPSKAFEMNAGYPATFLPGSFMYDVLGVAEVNYGNGARFKYAVSDYANYQDIQVDSLKTMAAFYGHMMAVEGMQAVNPQESIYHYASDYDPASSQGFLNGYSVGISRSYGAGKVICLSFPLYNMRTSDADQLVSYVLGSVFNEPSDVSDLTAPHVPSLTISSNYPNPFRNETTFIVHAPDKTKKLEIGVYNLRGQKVNTLYEGFSDDNLQLVWDGKDNRGTPTGSGIYFLKAATQSEVRVSRILRIR